MRTISRSLLLLAGFLPASEVALRAARFEYPRRASRSVVWSPDEDRAMRTGRSLHELDAQQMWRPRPGAPVPWTQDEKINAAGFRGPEIPIERQPGTLRIAVLGGTAACGQGVSWRDTFSTWIVRILAGHGVRAEAIDAAVSHSTVRQGLERYRASVRAFRPDFVICAYAGESEHLAAPRCVTDDDRISAGAALGSDAFLGGRFAALDPRSALRVGHAAGWLADVLGGPWWRERDLELKSLRLAASARTWDVGGVRRVSPIEFQSCLVTLGREVAADGGRLLLLSIPRAPASRADAGDSPVLDVYARVLADTAENEGFPLVSGRAALARAVREGVLSGDLFLDDASLSECAHSILARDLVDEIRTRSTGNSRRDR